MPVRLRYKTYWFRFKFDGQVIEQPSEFKEGQRAEAEKALRKLITSLRAGKEVFGSKKGSLHTVQDFCDAKFFPERRALLEDWRSDEGRMNLHVLPKIGPMPLREVRPRHLIDLFKGLRIGGVLAPKSIYNIYGVVKALFRDALILELVDSSPCVLNATHLGPNEDADPDWRETATFMRDEIETLISDSRLGADRHILYALKGIGATRNGEACALRWKQWEPSFADPATGALGKLMVTKSHGKSHTKTKRGRAMPVHPVLAAMLAEWKLHGWPAMMGRAPTPEDLIVPVGEPDLPESLVIDYPDAPPVTAKVAGVLSLEEAAEHCGRSAKSVRTWISSGRLRATKLALPHTKGEEANLIRTADLELFMRENKARNWGKGRRAEKGSMRTNSMEGKQFKEDLAMLGFRHRRGHDLRTAMITLTQEDGANQAILEACTHTPKSAKAISGYTRYSWAVRSAAVAKLKVVRRSHRGALLPMPGISAETAPKNIASLAGVGGTGGGTGAL